MLWSVDTQPFNVSGDTLTLIEGLIFRKSLSHRFLVDVVFFL